MKRTTLIAIAVTGVGAAALLLWRGGAHEAVTLAAHQPPAAGSVLGTPPPLPTDGTVAAAPAAAALPTAVVPASASPEQLRTELGQWRACLAAGNCPGPETDSRAMHFRAVAEMAARLKALNERADPATRQALAREYIGFPDGHVQAAALALAASTPPDAQTAQATLAALKATHDAELYRQAFAVLAQWQRAGLGSGMDDVFTHTLRQGGLHAGQAVAENLLPFLNDQNVSHYQALAAQLPEGSARRLALQQVVQEYGRLRTGG